MATMAIPHPPISERDAWRAVERRDARADGEFVYAVSSTRVYCRPSCPSRRPARTNVSFFPDPAAAEHAGFRACKRCNPRSADVRNSTARAIDRARAYLDAHSDRAVPLAELSRACGLSAAHLQRSFKRLVGMSPKEYHDSHRVRQFKTRLRAGDTVSRATYEAGFGSSSRVYERVGGLLGMTPGEYRRKGAGVHIEYTLADSPFGRVLIGMTERGVCAVELGGSDAEVERTLRRDFPDATLERTDNADHAWVRAVLHRLRDPRRARTAQVPLDLAGTAFQVQVWKALRAIPAGERRSYSDIARTIGRPKATRAVARACATNRVAVVIPCHRVAREDGGLAGYKWGIERKRRLLESEQA